MLMLEKRREQISKGKKNKMKQKRQQQSTVSSDSRQAAGSRLTFGAQHLCMARSKPLNSNTL
jgi:hypothetical protein